MRIFILEDNLNRIAAFRRKLIGHDVTVAETAQDAINILGSQKNLETRESLFDLIFLDHDLGGEEGVSPSNRNTGSAVVRWMERERPHCPPVIIHSHNPGAASSMHKNLKEGGFESHLIPFSSLLEKLDDPNFIHVTE